MSDQEQQDSVDPVVLSDVKASKRRTQVLKAVNQQYQTNSDIAAELNLSTQWVAQNMKWLEQHGLVEELTGKPNYKLYGITEKGERIVEHL